MKILWNCKDSPTCSSAYGKIAYYLIEPLAKRFPLAVLSPVGLTYGKLYFGGVPVYGGLQDITGEDVALEIYRREKADVYLTLA
ncbi:MAG: hypothetical protein QMD10_11410, partial [Desulfitobacteriaceae bacterium]|nr:hypothetical protein [Desulfitobacteriaceae bacterium]